jgi:putative peptidoglycan lipid II flippase
MGDYRHSLVGDNAASGEHDGASKHDHTEIPDLVEESTGSLSRPAVTMAAGTALSRLTGLGRLAAMAYAIGVAESRLADSFNIANTLPNVIFELILGGVLTSVFIPVLVEDIKTARDDDEAAARVSSLYVGTMGSLVALTVVSIVLAPYIIDVFAFRLPEETRSLQQRQATLFFRFFALEIVFYGYTALTAALLNAYHRFGAAAFAPVANNVVAIGTFLLFAKITPKELAAAGDPSRAGLLVLAVGTTGGVAAMAAAQWPAVRRLPLRLGIRLGIASIRQSSWPKLIRLSSWIFGVVVTNQIGFGIALVLANGVQGGPTAYFVAFAFFQLPIGLVAVSIITAVVPSIAGFWVERKTDVLSLRLVRAVRAMVVLLAPLTAAYVVLAGPAVAFLLERGVMSEASSHLVASTLVAFAIGVIPFSLWLLAVRSFYSMHDSKTPFVLNLVEVGVTVALDFVLYPPFKIVGLAAAHSAGYFVGSALALVVLFRNLEQRDAGRSLLLPLLKVAMAGTISGAVTWIALRLVGTRLRTALGIGGTTARLADLVVGGILVASVFIVAGLILRSDDLGMLRRIVNPKELFAEVEEAPVERRLSR